MANVVVVRPDRPAHTLIAAAFEMSGCEVRCASDAAAAWVLIVHRKPTILVIEYPEQVEGGIELLHRVEILRDRGTTIVATVANALSAEETRLVTGYTDLCYRMPTAPAEIIAAALLCATGKAALSEKSNAPETRSQEHLHRSLKHD